MKPTSKDAAATILVAAIVVPYAGYVVNGDMPLLHEPRSMAGIALVLGLLACSFGGSSLPRSDVIVKIAGALGAVALALGVAAGVTGNEWLLAGFIGAIVLLWAVTTARHVHAGRTGRAAAPTAPVARGSRR